MIKHCFVTVLVCACFTGCFVTDRDNPIQLDGYYFIKTIDVLKDIQVDDYKTQLMISKEGEISFPIALRDEELDSTATWELIRGETSLFLKISSKDSTLDGRWQFNDMKLKENSKGRKAIQAFEIQNQYYILECELMMRFGY